MLRPTTIALLSGVITALLLAACHPFSPPKIPEPPLEGPEASPIIKTEPPPEPQAPAAPAEVPAKPGRMAIPRLLPESIVGIPEKDLASRRLEYNTMMSSRSGEPPHVAAWEYRTTRQGQIVGFEFSNFIRNSVSISSCLKAENTLLAENQFAFLFHFK